MQNNGTLQQLHNMQTQELTMS